MLTDNHVHNLHTVFNRAKMVERLYKQLVKANAMPRTEITNFITTQYEADYNALTNSELRKLFADPTVWKARVTVLFDALDSSDLPEPKTLKYHTRSNKNYPIYGVAVGQPHYSWSVSGMTVRSLTNPFKAVSPAQLQEAA